MDTDARKKLIAGLAAERDELERKAAECERQAQRFKAGQQSPPRNWRHAVCASGPTRWAGDGRTSRKTSSTTTSVAEYRCGRWGSREAGPRGRVP